MLLRRYGVVFRRLLERESLPVTWYELGRIYRRWEARGEIRGGYFVGGVGGEQFALPEAIGLLRSIRKSPAKGELITLSAADPLNLQGILTPGPRISALTSNRILFRDGLPMAALEAGEIRKLAEAPVSIRKWKRLLKSENFGPPCGRTTNDCVLSRFRSEVEVPRTHRFISTWNSYRSALHAFPQDDERLRRRALFLNYLGVLEHGDAATLGQLAFHGDVFAAVFSELIVDRLVFADDQIRFALADDADRSTTLDALCPAGLAMFFADGIMIDVAHHIDHFAGHLF